MLDAETIRKIEVARELAARDGVDLIELLDRYRLILTRELRAAIGQEALAHALNVIEEQPTAMLVRLGGENTVAGAVRGAVALLRLTMQVWK